MSVGPVGPGGGIYPIIYDVVCKVNFQKLIWRPNNRGYMQLCLCLWALSLFFKYTLYTTPYYWIYHTSGQTVVDICSYAYVCGPCRARRWDIFNCRGCCVQGIFSTKQIWSQIIVDICSFAYVCGPCRARRWGIFNCRGCCVQPINLHVSCKKKTEIWQLSASKL